MTVMAGRWQGMLLDLDAATLTVFVNGERRGVMVRPGMVFDAPGHPYHGQPVPRLVGVSPTHVSGR